MAACTQGLLAQQSDPVTLPALFHSAVSQPVTKRASRKESISEACARHGRRRAEGPRLGLPPARSRVLGKLGPSFGFGAGCGFGIGVGLIGGAGVGSGFPGLSMGFGVGAGCGIGIGFGYGFGKGVAYDENGRYSNIGRSNQKSRGTHSEDQIDILVDELIENTKKPIKATLKEIDKWRRA